MSYFEHHEFVVLDRTLTRSEQDQLRRYSSRAEISATSFTNSYNWGSAGFDPEELLVKYFDAYCCWTASSFELMLRLPAECLALRTINAFSAGSFPLGRRVGKHVVLYFGDEELEFHEGWHGTSLLSTLLSLRKELIEGDLRCLYLAWLQSVQLDQVDAGKVEPALPPGMASLSPAQQELVSLMGLDDEIVAAAAEGSVPLISTTLTDKEVRQSVDELSEREKTTFLVKLARDDANPLATQLRKRLGAFDRTAMAARSSDRTVGTLMERAHELHGKRQAREARRSEKERKLAEAEASREQEARLALLEEREAAEWRRVHSLIRDTTARSYGQAVIALEALQELAVARGRGAEFAKRLTRLREKHSRKSRLLSQLDKLGLTEDPAPPSKKGAEGQRRG